MDELQTLEARVRARGDQVVEHMRNNVDDIKRVAQTDPSQWTSDDHNVILATLSGVVGLIYEGRI